MITVLAAFAVWKLSAMLMDYDGPFGIIKLVRDTIIKAQDRVGRKLLNFGCFFCFSTVIALPAALRLADGWDIPIYWLGLAGMAWLLNIIDEALV